MSTPLPAQHTTTISGRVTDASTGQPVAGARILLSGSSRSATSTADGSYTLTRVPPGRLELRAIAIGYRSQAATMSVVTGGIVTVDFQMERAVISLDEITVTATGEQRRREIGNAIGSIQAADLVELAPVTSATDLLTARVPGVIMRRDGGATGTGAILRIRGATSISLRNDPLVFVDGVRVEGRARGGLWVGGQVASRLDDLNPEEIESVEIVKGPSAATLYGTEAANGVIRITTKRGAAGATRWSAYTEQGALWDPHEYPANYAGVDADNPIPPLRQFCTLDFVAQGRCEQERVSSFSPLEHPASAPFGTGRRQQYGVNASGGTEELQYFFAAEWENETGVARLPDAVADSLVELGTVLRPEERHPNAIRRVHLRSNIRAQVGETADVTIAAGYVSSRLRRIRNDYAISEGILPSGLYGRAFEEQRGGWRFALPEQALRAITFQDMERFTTSIQSTWNPLPFLSARATVGLDFASQDDDYTDFVFSATGFRSNTRDQLVQQTVDLGATARFRVSGAITSRTSVGAQYFRRTFEGVLAIGEDLPAGCRAISCATTQDATDLTSEDNTLGMFVEQQFGLNDRLFVSGALRADDNSAFGRDFDVVIYPKLQGSWLISEETFFPGAGWIDELRVRAAWGSSGLQPGGLQSVRFFFGSPATVGGRDVPAVTFGEVGNPELKPERSTEVEAGVDAALFSGRVGVELTYYHMRTSDALVNRDLPPSLGLSFNRFDNLGSVRNRGVEIAINTQLVNSDAVRWELVVSGATNTNELLELGEGVEAQTFQSGYQRMVPGFSLGGWWDRPILDFNDDDGNGILTGDEIVVADSAEFLGHSDPTRHATLHTNVTLFDRLRLSGLVDYQGGHLIVNATDAFRCQVFRVCRELHDPATPIDEQARAVATAYHPSGTFAGYVEPGWFVKLREVAATFFFPDSWAGTFGVSRASLTVTARNLATWTDYTGLDPETNADGGANFARLDFTGQPPVRYFSARLNLTF